MLQSARVGVFAVVVIKYPEHFSLLDSPRPSMPIVLESSIR